MGSSSKWVLWKPIRFRRQSSIMACLNPLCLQQASAGFPESFWITAQHIDKQYHRYRGLTSLCMTNDQRSVGETVGFSFQLVFTNGFQLEALHIRNLYSPPSCGVTETEREPRTGNCGLIHEVIAPRYVYWYTDLSRGSSQCPIPYSLLPQSLVIAKETGNEDERKLGFLIKRQQISKHSRCLGIQTAPAYLRTFQDGHNTMAG